MRDLVNVTSQAELDRAVQNGDIPVCRNGCFRASGSATVWASGSTTVWASGSATVWASDSATVWASDSATVWASNSATVWASGSATVWASGSTTVRASEFVGVTRHGTKAKVNGGVLIQIPEIKTAQDFLDFYELKVSRGTVTLYKLVNDEFVSGHGTRYWPGEQPTAENWNPAPCCGGGLHFSPRPFLAHRYSSGTRYMACRVKLSDLVVIIDYETPDKCKARTCKVLHECDSEGEKVGS